MSRSSLVSIRCSVLGVALLAAACAPPEPAAPEGPPPTPMREARSAEGAVTLTLPADLSVHPHRDAVLATSPDGAFRLAIERIPADLLIRHAGAAKDELHARGWEVEAEEHYEYAILLRLKRGGTARGPAERREMWWVDRGSAPYLCDGLATPAGFGRLGESHREICQAASVAPPGPPAPGDASP